MTVNRKMFAEIHQLLVEFPELHQQAGWEASPRADGLCGTTRCVAGWATWIGARDHGLLSRKRDMTSLPVRRELATRLGLANVSLEGEWYYEDYAPHDHPVLGGKLLGLDDDQANSLFHDYNNDRVLARVKSFAETGEDLSEDEILSFDRDDD